MSFHGRRERARELLARLEKAPPAQQLLLVLDTLELERLDTLAEAEEAVRALRRST